jgi:hypothetical protein
MLNKDALARDPGSFVLVDGGVAKVRFPPEPETLPVLREQLQMFVCEGAYSDALRKILDAYNAVAATKNDTPAVWISGFYGSGKSLLASMLGALWADVTFPDGATAEGLIHGVPSEVTAALRELRTTAKRLNTRLVVAGVKLGEDSDDPFKAVLQPILRAAGLPGTSDLRPMLCALWLSEQGILKQVREALGTSFQHAIESFTMDDRVAAAAVAAKPSLGTAQELLGRFLATYANEPEPTASLLFDKARQALTLGGQPMPLTLVILDEVQQFVREDGDRSLAIDVIAEGLASRFGGRVLLVGTGQSALNDTPFLAKFLGRFPLRLPLGSSDIQSVIRKTLLRKKPEQVPAVQKMLDSFSGEIDKQLQGTLLRRTEADRQLAVADWPMLAPRRRLWDRVTQELDRTGLGGTLRGQLWVMLTSLRQCADRPITTAIAGDSLLDSFGAEALSRDLIGREFFDKVQIQRAQSGDGPLKARIMLLVYMLGRIAGDAATHGVRATSETLADLLIDDLSQAAATRAKVPALLAAMAEDGILIEVAADEWRLQSKESAEWQVAFNKAQSEEANDSNGVARFRADLLKQVLEEALAKAVRRTQGASNTARPIERAVGDAKPEGSGLVLRLWNEWDNGKAPLDEIKAADVNKDATIHLFVPIHRNHELTDAIVTHKAAALVLQRQGVPTTNGGKEAKAAMEAKLAAAQKTAHGILTEAVNSGLVLLAGGAEIGAGQTRSDAVLGAAGRVLDRLYPDFGVGDHASWGVALAKAKAGAPDALKIVDHQGDAHLHPVCKTLLKAMGSGKQGAELRKLFTSAPYGWPVEAIHTGLRMLALTGQVRVKGADHKPVDLLSLNDQAIGTCTFDAASPPVSLNEKLAVRGLGTLLGLTISAGEELAKAPMIVERLQERAAAAGGGPPAPAAPTVPGWDKLQTATGNDLLAELAVRKPEVESLIPAWTQAAKLRDARMAQWALAQTLIELGATGQRAEADAIRSQRLLLAEPDPVAPLVATACTALRQEADAAYTAWRAAWEYGEAELKASPAWNTISQDKRHGLRAEHNLREYPPPDLSTPAAIVASLKERNCSQWRDMAAAHPARVQAALKDAQDEVEPKTQYVRISRPTMRTEAELDDWLAGLRTAIAPLLASGPVLPIL